MSKEIPSRVADLQRDIHLFARKSTRQFLDKNRRSHRDEASDQFRGVSTASINKETVIAIAQKLKTSAREEELRQLKNALLDDVTLIEEVLSHHGALRGIVREISGRDIKKQLQAAGCCGNLALGGERAAKAVVRAAGGYLAALLGSMSEELAVTCAWALGNLAGTSPKVAEELIAQGALSRLVKATAGTRSTQDAAIYAIEHVVYQLSDTMSPNLHQELVSSLSKIDNTAVWRPLFLLSCHPNCLQINHDMNRIISAMYVNIETRLTCENNNEIDYIARYLANLCTVTNTCDWFIESLIKDDACGLLNKMVKREVEDYLWLIGNVVNYASIGERKQLFLEIICR